MTIQPGLYIVSTPIGNLDDITLRALDVLKSSDIILCEDTRVSRKLLAKHKIDAPLLVYNDKSNNILREKVIQMVTSGQKVSLISDAGTPLISDPGFKLVRHFYQLNLHVDVVPGACAPIAALSFSGLPSDSFFFGGFLPKTSEQRKKKFQQVYNYNATLIFFETASRIASTISDAYAVLGNREAVIARELTKMFQERIAGDLESVSNRLQKNKIKGEVVLLISGEKARLPEDTNTLDNAIIKKLSQGTSARDIADMIFTEQPSDKESRTKAEIYRYVNLIKSKNDLKD